MLIYQIIGNIIGLILWELIVRKLEKRTGKKTPITFPPEWENLKLQLMDYEQTLTDIDQIIQFQVHRRNAILDALRDRRREIRQIERAERRAERARRREEKRLAKLEGVGKGAYFTS